MLTPVFIRLLIHVCVCVKVSSAHTGLRGCAVLFCLSVNVWLPLSIGAMSPWHILGYTFLKARSCYFLMNFVYLPA